MAFLHDNPRARWGLLGPGHLGAQEASVVRVVEYCNEQIQPNLPEKQHITTCSKAMQCGSHGHLCCSPLRGLVLRACAALP